MSTEDYINNDYGEFERRTIRLRNFPIQSTLSDKEAFVRLRPFAATPMSINAKPEEHWEAGADLFAEHSRKVRDACADLEARTLAESKLRAKGWKEVQPGFWVAPSSRYAVKLELPREYQIALGAFVAGMLFMVAIAWLAKL